MFKRSWFKKQISSSQPQATVYDIPKSDPQLVILIPEPPIDGSPRPIISKEKPTDYQSALDLEECLCSQHKDPKLRPCCREECCKHVICKKCGYMVGWICPQHGLVESTLSAPLHQSLFPLCKLTKCKGKCAQKCLRCDMRSPEKRWRLLFGGEGEGGQA